ncbi:hypothetical protein L3X38_021816 [Prunus dulcis]|uniref:Uncharacterized protein n=1 Tax=Prunus dulcis TaxID=3755 RepID=A0AAD4Z3Q6_PRUDU|nr:hypothetical protein L3X38_021816 [Prunus dulcis]
MQKLPRERLAQIERAERHIESLQREKRDLDDELERIRVSEMGAHSKVALLEARVEEREKEIESLLKSNNEQRTSTVHILQGLLDTLDIKLKTASHGKCSRVDDYEMGMDSVQDMEMSDRIVRVNKRSRSNTSPLKHTQAEDGGSVFKGDEDTRKWLELYESCMLQKS